MTEPAEASQPFVPTPQLKKPKHKGRIIAAVIGGVAVVAIVAAIVVVTRVGASSEVTSGGKGYVVCACETKILPTLWTRYTKPSQRWPRRWNS